MKIVLQLCVLGVSAWCRLTGAESTIDARIARHVAEFVAVAAAPEIVAAVAEQNLHCPVILQAMTQEKWAALSRVDPLVYKLKKIPALKALAPTQAEPPFAIAQGVALVGFIILGILAAKRFHPEAGAMARA